jgi:hypothetical protein
MGAFKGLVENVLPVGVDAFKDGSDVPAGGLVSEDNQLNQPSKTINLTL